MDLTPPTGSGVAGPATRAARRFIARATIIVISGWTLLFTFVLVATPVDPQLLPWVFAAALALLGSTALFARRGLPTAWFYNIVVVVCAVLLVATSTIGDGEPDYFSFIGWACVIGVAAGVLLPRKTWRRTLIITVGCMFLLLVCLELITPDLAVRLVVSAPLAALAYGLVAGIMFDSVLRVGALDDESAERAIQAAEAQKAAAALSDESFRLSRMLHDGIVNTLGGIRWSDAADGDWIRSRCARDLEQIEQIQQPSVAQPADHDECADAVALLRNVRATARANHMALNSEVRGAAIEVPAQVLDALRGALDEAILNAKKHGQANTADLAIDSTGSVLQVRFEGRGRGIAPGADLRADGGIARSITARCARAEVEHTLEIGEAGQVVHWFTWYASPIVTDSLLENQTSAGRLRGQYVLRSAVVTIAATSLVASLSRLVADIPFDWEMATWWWWLTMLALTGTAGAIGVLGARGTSVLSRWRCMTLTVSIFVIAAVPSSSTQSCVEPGFGVWQSYAAMTVAGTLMWLTTGYGWTLAAAVAFVAGWGGSLWVAHLVYGCSGEMALFLVVDPLVLAGFWLIRHYLDNVGNAAQDSIEATGKARQAEADLVNRHFVRQKVWEIAVAAGVPLLRDIRDGRKDPRAPEVREEAELIESLLRNCSQLEVGQDPLAAVILDLCRKASLRGISVDLNHAAAPPPATSALAEIARILTDLAQTAVPDSRMSIVSLDGAGEGSLIINVMLPDGSGPPQAQGPSVEVRTFTHGGIATVELQWLAARPNSRAQAQLELVKHR